MESFTRGARHTLRRLRRSPGFTTVAVLTLTLGIGANTAIFSVINGVLLRSLPYPEPKEVVQIRHVNENGGAILNFAYPNFVDLRELNGTFDAMAAYADVTASVTTASEPLRVEAAWVTEGFFDVLGVKPEIGRAFLPEEFGVASGVVIVGYNFWRSRLGGDPDLTDAVVRVGEMQLLVTGVMPEGFSFPDGVELWAPSDATLASESRTAHNYRVIGRLGDGVPIGRARADLSAIAARLAAIHGDNTAMADAAVVPLREEIVGRTRPALLILFGAAGFLLLITCANVVNLLLARMASRQRELTVRLALGAGRGRIVTQYLGEALALSLVGGALGVMLAVWGVPALLALEPGRLPRLEAVGVDLSVLAFALGVSLLVALALGTLPALRAAGGDVRASLSEGQRTQAGGASSHRIRGGLVVSQIALTLVLLVGAGLLGQSFLRLLSIDPGYRTEGALVMDLWIPSATGAAAETRVRQFHTDLFDRLRAMPAVEEVGGVSVFPLTGGGGDGTFVILESAAEVAGLESFEQVMRDPALIERVQRLFQDPTRTGDADFRIASAGYFRAMGIPLVRGRLFDERDLPDAEHVAVISRSLARERWANEDPIGEIIEFGNMDGDLTPFTIVGIVGDVRERALAARPRSTFYGYYLQRPRRTFQYHVVMRGVGDPETMIAAARSIVRELNPGVPVRFRTVEQILSASVADRRFVLLLLGFFSATALLLAVLGIYGVISYLATQRTREMGIRMALGARGPEVRRLLVGQGAKLALVGVAIGLVAAFALTRLLDSLLYGVGSADPLTFAAVALVLGGVAVLASWIPALRASRLDPMTTLRME